MTNLGSVLKRDIILPTKVPIVYVLMWESVLYNIMYEMSCQSRFDARYWMLGASALGWQRGMVWEGGGLRMGNTCIPVADSFWYLAKLIHFVKFKNKIKFKKKKKKKAEYRRTDAFELCWRSLSSSLDSKKIKAVNPKGNQPWICTGRTDAEVPIFWPPDSKSRVIGKTLMLGKIEGRRKRG